jgi:hypothetical protein
VYSPDGGGAVVDDDVPAETWELLRGWDEEKRKKVLAKLKLREEAQQR